MITHRLLELCCPKEKSDCVVLRARVYTLCGSRSVVVG